MIVCPKHNNGVSLALTFAVLVTKVLLLKKSKRKNISV